MANGQDDDGDRYRPVTAAERVAALEARFHEFRNESKADRSKLHEKMEEVEDRLSDQINKAAVTGLIIEIVKWAAGLAIAGFFGYYLDHVGDKSDRNFHAIEQMQHPPAQQEEKK